MISYYSEVIYLNELGNILRNARIEKGYTMAYVAEKTGIKNSRLSRIERGLNKKEPPANDLNTLLNLYELDRSTLQKSIDDSDTETKEDCLTLKNLHMLNVTELAHIQEEIDFILSLKGIITNEI